MAKAIWLFDTDVLIDYLRGNPQAIKFLEKAMTYSSCYISTITIAELYAVVRENEERQILDQFIGEFQHITIDPNTAKKGGLYRRDYGRNHGVGLADAIIAASAEFVDAKLVTLNKKHYPMTKKIYIPYQQNAAK